MNSSSFLTGIMLFAAEEDADGKKLPEPRPKDMINEETMELLEPYLRVSDFNDERMKGVCVDAVGLVKWNRAMAKYHEAARIVGSMLEQLQIKTGLYKNATGKLRAAQATSNAAQDRPNCSARPSAHKTR